MAVAFLRRVAADARLVARYGRSVITVGGALQLAGLLVAIWALEASWPHDLAVAAAAQASSSPASVRGWSCRSLIRVVLSEVPVESAGAGSGVLTTTQQIASRSASRPSAPCS